MIWWLSWAFAASPTDAELARAVELYDLGTALYDEGQYEQAIAAFEESFELSERGLLWFNIANARERLGDLQGTLEALEQYKAFAPLSEASTLERRILSLRSRIPTEVRPVPDPVLPVPVAPEPIVTPTAPRRGVGVPTLLIGAGAGAVAGGVVSGFVSRNAGKKAKLECVGAQGGVVCPKSVENDLQRNKRFALVADVAIITGAVLAGTGVVVATTKKGDLSVAPNGITWQGHW